MPATTLPLPETVPASLLYFTPPENGSRPYVHINDVPDRPKKNWVSAKHTVQIENIRGKEDTVSLDTAGFQFYKHPAKHTSFETDEEIEKEYYPESVELIKKLTGASKVVLFDHSEFFVSFTSIFLCSMLNFHITISYTPPPSRRS
jgi:hypothetical protein